MRVFQRIVSAIVGVVLLGATLVAASYIDIGRGSGIVGWLVPGVLAASALYMAVKLFRVAFQRQ